MKIVIGVFCVVCMWVIALMSAVKGRYYDCTLAEMHPDYPVRVKQACRELRREK